MIIEELSKDVVGRLAEPLQILFVEAFNKAEGEGKSEPECLRAGWTRAVSQNSRVIHDTFLFQPGNWDAAGGDGRITEDNAKDAIFSIQRCEELGAPLGVKYQHSNNSESIPIGVALNIVEKPGIKAYGDVYIYQDARSDKDGSGSKILATIDQIADALLTDGMKVSIEADRNIKVPSYYGDKLITLEPTSVAILPTGVKPAIVEKIVAGRGGGQRFFFQASENKEGNEEMTLEELAKMVEEGFKAIGERLEKLEEIVLKEDEPGDDEPTEAVAELQRTIDEQQGKLDTIEEEKLKAEVAGLLENVKKKLTYGEVEKLEEDLGDAVKLSEKKVVLTRLNTVLEDIPETSRKMKAGRAVSKSEDKFNTDVSARMKETGEGRFEASRAVLETMTDADIETKEVEGI